MRFRGGMRGLICAALVVGSFGVVRIAVAGILPSAPPQCGDYADILDYYAGVSDFTGTGLSISDCSALCKKAAGECKDYVAKANACSKKAVSDQAGLDRKEFCKPLEGTEKQDCKEFYNNAEDVGRDTYKDGAAIAKEACESIRDSCISDCED